jgi:adenylosuccinate lyase
MSNDIYTSPLTGRYSSLQMQKLFSLRTRFSTWRALWLWLAESQKELGLDISDEAIDQMRANLTVQDDEFEVIAKEEKRRRSV